MKKILFAIIFCIVSFTLFAQSFEEVRETKKQYIQEHHIEDVEKIVHRLAQSKDFLNVLLESGHNFDPNDVHLKKKDVRVGEDIDLYVNHLSEHQSFSMLLIPISIYKLQVYDTILFTSLEVSDAWIERTFAVANPEEATKQRLLSEEGHRMLERHILNQAAKSIHFDGMGEVKVKLHESYISGSHAVINVKDLTKEERHSLTASWGLMKKVLTHAVDMNVELNAYVFGVDDLDVTFLFKNKEKHFRANPSNVFQRHKFIETASNID